MKTLIKPRTAAPNGAGNNNEKLAKAWLAWARGGSPLETATLGEIADEELRRILKPGTLRGALRGREEDLRQDAAELLFGAFLHGNTRLAKATAAGRIDEIAGQISRSIAAAAKFGRKRYIKRLQQEIQRRALLAKAVEDRVLIQAAQDGFGLNHDARIQLAIAALAHAVKSGLINRESEEMTRAFLRGEKLQKEIAEEHGVSTAAVSKRLGRAAAAVKKIIERGEVEL